MIFYQIAAAWRTLVSNPLFSLVTISSLAVGACAATLIGSNILSHLSFERWIPHADRVMMITRSYAGADSEADGAPDSSILMPLKDALKGQIPGLAAQTRLISGTPLIAEDAARLQAQSGQPAEPGGLERTADDIMPTAFVDPDFFKVFPLMFLEGSGSAIGDPNKIVIDKSLATRLFGNAPALGRTIEGRNSQTLEVIGVVKDLPVTTHLRFNLVAGMSTLMLVTPAARSMAASWQTALNGAHYIRADVAADLPSFRTAARSSIQSAFDHGPATSHAPGATSPRFSVVPIVDIHLGGQALTGLPSTGDSTMLAVLGAVAFAILGISVFNFVILSLARAVSRRREVGIRKAMGASGASLFSHYTTEAVLAMAIAAVAGFLAAMWLAPWFARLLNQPAATFALFDPLFLTGALILFFLVALAAGSYPAIYLAGMRPTASLRAGGPARSTLAGKALSAILLAAQIATATSLLIVAFTMQSQANFISKRPLGFSVADRYVISPGCPINISMQSAELSAQLRTCRTILHKILPKAPGVSQIGYFGGDLFSDNLILQPFGLTSTSTQFGQAVILPVDTNFLENAGAELLAGRLFDSASAYDRQLLDAPLPSAGTAPALPERLPVVVSRAFTPLLGASSPDELIGHQISRLGSPYALEIIGVVSDWQQRSLRHAVSPIVFLPAGTNKAIARISEDDLLGTVAWINDAWKRELSSSSAAVGITAMRDSLSQFHRADLNLMQAVTIAALTATAIAAIGVVGLTAFQMRRRVREIGIRKSLGATSGQVASQIMARAAILAAVASIAGWPIGEWASHAWLQGFYYRTDFNFGTLPAASIIIVGVVFIATAINALPVAWVRPNRALRFAE